MTDALRPGDKLGNSELILQIGRGGMATIWVARQYVEKFKEERLVAVKAMLPELVRETQFVSMFLDEGGLVKSIRHPNVVEVYEVGEQNGIMYMSMEWVEGESLHTIIAEAGKRRAIPPEIAVRIIADTAAGLHAAHDLRDEHGKLKGVVHRDVSPHNILIGTDGAVKLVDFGVAKAMGRISDETRVGQIKGKFGYMSPEQALGKHVDRRSDIFSIGIVLFELTTNRRLFRGATDIETLRLVVSGEVPKPTDIDPEYPPALERIVVKALERRIEDRYQTADAMRIDLEQYLKNERTVVPRSGVAGLLKRVLGTHIDERRREVRATLLELRQTGSSGGAGLRNTAFTPTGASSPHGRERRPSRPSPPIEVTGVPTVVQGPRPATAPPRPTRRPLYLGVALAALALAGILLALLR